MAGIPQEALDRDLYSDKHVRLIAKKLQGWENYPELFGLAKNPDVHDIQNDKISYPSFQSQR